MESAASTVPASTAGIGRDRSRGATAVALTAFAVSRVVVLLAGVFAVELAGVRWENAVAYDPEGVTRPFGALGDTLVAPAARWDAVWFLDIADDGYDGQRAAFFPLYPLLVKAAGALTGSAVVGGIAVSLAALLVALVLLHRLVALDFGDEVASLTVVLVAVCPAALWFGAVYSESLFLALSVGAVYAARTDRWALAGLAGGLAAATRSAGLVLLVPLAILWWTARRDAPARQRGLTPLSHLGWLALVPAGLVAFCVALGLSGEDPLAPFSAQDAWDRSFVGPYGAILGGAVAGARGIGQLWSGEPRPTVPFDPAVLDAMLLGTLVVVLVALAGALRRLPPAYGLYALAALALPLSFPVEGQPLMSLPRFAAVLWPLHLWLALWLVDRAPAVRHAVVGVSLAGLAVTSGLVATWSWVA
jgi:hypothetical protein